MKKEKYNGGQVIVNYKNVDCIETVKVEDDYEIYYLYKSKIKVEKLKLPKIFKDVLTLRKYFNDLGFYNIGNYFINSNNFEVLEELEYDKDLDTQTVKIYMKNTQPIEVTVNRNVWLSFRNTKLA